MRLLLGEAHRKLIKECSLPTPNLRQLVGHANLVDVLVISIQYTRVQRDDELSQSMSACSLSAPEPKKSKTTRPQVRGGNHNCYRPDFKGGAFDTVDELPSIDLEMLNGYSY